MFNLWNETERFDVFQTKKTQNFKSIDGEKNYSKHFHDLTFKIKGRKESDTLYFNLFPQACLKFTYEIQALIKGKLSEAKKSFTRKGSDNTSTTPFISISVFENDYIITMSDGVSNEKSIPITKVDLYILYEYLHKLSLDLMTDKEEFMDLTKKRTDSVVPEFEEETLSDFDIS